MSGRPQRTRLVWVLLTAAVLLDALVAVAAPLAVAPPRAALAVVAPGPRAAGRFLDPASAAPGAATGTPERILIPAIHVDAGIERLHRDAAGVLQPPDSWTKAGWFAAGTRPGAIGPAVIAGHLDTTKRVAVFGNLRLLRPGDRIAVRMSTGRTVRFVVTHSRVVQKALFPTDEVYGPTPDAQLRLITCSEPFDEARGSYADNLVVFATKAD